MAAKRKSKPKKSIARKGKKAKAKRPVKKAAKKSKAKKATSAKKRKAPSRHKTKRVRPATFEELVPSGEPLFVTPMEEL